MLKECKQCRSIKDIKEFYSKRGGKLGVTSICKECFKIEFREYYLKHKEKCLKTKKKYFELHKEEQKQRCKNHYEKHKEEYKTRHLKWRAEHKEMMLEYGRKWSRINVLSRRAKNNKRRADKMNRTPKWADLEAVKQFYINCPKGMVVDHIVPLRGKFVSGLHVLANLQYLTPSENSKKRNKFIPYCEFYMEGK